jgi:hypothetical protein
MAGFAPPDTAFSTRADRDSKGGFCVGPKYRCPVFSKVEMSGFSVSIRQGRVSWEEPACSYYPRKIRLGWQEESTGTAAHLGAGACL